MLDQLIAIAVGGAVGALLRFWLSTGVYALLGRGFPYGTLSVNVLFFDEPAKVSAILEHLAGILAPDHIVSWQARVNKEVQERETSA